MKLGRGRAKGGGFEGVVGALFTKWWDRPDCKFQRTDVLQTRVAKERIVFGDIVPVILKRHSYDLTFPFSVECKADESLDLLSLFKVNVQSPIETWWEQCSRDAKSFSRIPLLVMKKNYWPILCVYPTYVERQLAEFVNREVWVKGAKTTLDGEAVFVVELQGFFARYNPMWKKSEEVALVQ